MARHLDFPDAERERRHDDAIGGLAATDVDRVQTAAGFDAHHSRSFGCRVIHSMRLAG